MTLDEFINSVSVAGPKLSDPQVQGLEKRLGVQLPTSYRAFLLGCNGGMLDARFTANGVYPDIMYGIRKDDHNYSLGQAMLRARQVVRAGHLPIGNEHSINSVLSLDLAGPDAGSVSLWTSAGRRTVASSFLSFVEALAPAEHRSPDDIHHDDVRHLMSQERFAEALAAFQAAWALRSQAKHAHGIAQTLTALGELQQSYQWCERAYALDPKHYKTATTHAANLLEQGRRGEAIDVLQRILYALPTYGPATRLLDEAQQ